MKAGSDPESLLAATAPLSPVDGDGGPVTPAPPNDEPAVDGGNFQSPHEPLDNSSGGASSGQCDACPHCADTCDNVECRPCGEKKKRLAPVEDETDDDGTDFLFLNDFRSIMFGGRRREREYTRCQLRRHTNAESAWLLVGDGIYDVTSRLNRHPGGIRSLLDKCGGPDCARDMRFHSRTAVKMWKALRVGRLVPCPGDEVSTSDGGDCFLAPGFLRRVFCSRIHPR